MYSRKIISKKWLYRYFALQ